MSDDGNADNENGNGSEGVVAEVKLNPTMQIGHGDIKPNIYELPDSTKPTVHISKKKKRQNSYRTK